MGGASATKSRPHFLARRSGPGFPDEDVAKVAVEFAAKAGAQYSDVRSEVVETETIIIVDGEIQKESKFSKRGVGVRTLIDGAWGFGSATQLNRTNARHASQMATRLAKVTSKVGGSRVSLAPSRTQAGSYITPTVRHLEEVALEEKARDMLELSQEIRDGNELSSSTVEFSGKTSRKLFANSEGSIIRSRVSMAWVTMRAIASQEAVTQSYVKTIGGYGGYERVSGEDSLQLASEVGQSAIRLSRAIPMKAATNQKVILDPSFGCLLAHELIAHPCEADRVIGRESAFGGSTWWPGLGAKVGSDSMTVYDDPTLLGGPFGEKYDDEGIVAIKRVLINKGMLNELIQSRETAQILGAQPNGGMRALAFDSIPLVRMSNTFFGGGDQSLEEMIRDTKNGFLISSWKQPSIDERRYDWTISAYEAKEIKNGELNRTLRNPTLYGNAPSFFRSIDAVTEDLKMFPLPGCGKGEPIQSALVGGGGAWIRGVVNTR